MRVAAAIATAHPCDPLKPKLLHELGGERRSCETPGESSGPVFLFLIVLCHDTGFLHSGLATVCTFMFGHFERLLPSDLHVIQQILLVSLCSFTRKLLNGQKRSENILLLNDCPHSLALNTLMFFEPACLLLHICLLLLVHVPRQQSRQTGGRAGSPLPAQLFILKCQSFHIDVLLLFVHSCCNTQFASLTCVQDCGMSFVTWKHLIKISKHRED